MAIVAPVLGFTPKSHTHSLTLRLLAYGAVNLYTVISPPVSSGNVEFLWVLYYCGVQGLRDGDTLAGRACVCAYALNRNEDSF